MKKVTLGFILLTVVVVSGQAADTTTTAASWKTALEVSLAATQASYSDNWTGGEVGSLVWAANVHGVAEKQLTDLLRVENDLKLAFGQTHSQSETTKNWAAPVKSSDKIRFDTVWKITLKAWVDPYAAGVFESQFYDASDPQQKRYVNPVDLTESAGISRTIFDQATGKLSSRMGFGLRQKFRKSTDYTDYTVAASGDTTFAELSESLNDGGLEWVTDWVAQVSKTLTYTSKLTVFQALFASAEDPAGNWQETDLNWDNILTANVTKIVQVSFAWQLLYDKEISEGGRFKETLALGVAWKI